MDHFQQARKLLPRMPEEVFKLWFDGRIEANGWPPRGERWRNALRGWPIGYWKRLRWALVPIPLHFNSFTEKSRTLLVNLVDAIYYDADNSLKRYLGDESKVRCGRILAHIRTERRLPGALVLVATQEGFELVDGCHRCATYFEAKRGGVSDELLSPEVEAWIGAVP